MGIGLKKYFVNKNIFIKETNRIFDFIRNKNVFLRLIQVSRCKYVFPSPGSDMCSKILTIRFLICEFLTRCYCNIYGMDPIFINIFLLK